MFREISDSIGVDVDVAAEVPTVFDESHARRVIEAVLFAAGHPVTYAKLAEVLSTTVATVRETVRRYADEYNDIASPLERGIMLLCYEDSCQLASCEAYGDHIRTALGIKRGGNLSPSSLEVLAIIAYNEPVTRVYVDTVRGVDSGYAVNSLADRQLIEPCGRLDAPGRPILYRTTKNFLRVFGLNSLSDLPAVKTGDAPQNGGTIPLAGMDDLPPAAPSDDEANAEGEAIAGGDAAADGSKWDDGGFEAESGGGFEANDGGFEANGGGFGTDGEP